MSLNRIRESLDELELTQAEIARRSGVSYGSVNRYTNHRARPTRANARRVFEAIRAHDAELAFDHVFPLGAVHGSDECSRGSVKEILEDVLRRDDVEGKKLSAMGLNSTKKTQIRMDINGCCADDINPEFSDGDVKGSDTLDTLWNRVTERRVE